VSSDLNCQQVYFCDLYKESVVVKIKLSNGQLLYIANVYRSLSYGKDITENLRKSQADQPFQWENPKQPLVFPKPLNFSTPKFAQMITSGISPDVQNIVKIKFKHHYYTFLFLRHSLIT